MISNVNSLAIVTSSICEPWAIVTSHWSIVLTLYQWTLSSSQWRCQPGRFSMAAHHSHDRRGIYRCVLLRFRGRIEIDHSYGLRWSGLCCHSRHSTRGAGRRGRKRPRVGRPHSCCAGSGSTNHSSADRIVVNSYNLPYNSTNIRPRIDFICYRLYKHFWKQPETTQLFNTFLNSQVVSLIYIFHNPAPLQMAPGIAEHEYPSVLVWKYEWYYNSCNFVFSLADYMHNKQMQRWRGHTCKCQNSHL